ncbi:hypothetical protein EMCRGX_G025129 [Ephydatia muelleri]
MQPLTRRQLKETLLSMFDQGDADSLCCFQCHGTFTIRLQRKATPPTGIPEESNTTHWNSRGKQHHPLEFQRKATPKREVE